MLVNPNARRGGEALKLVGHLRAGGIEPLVEQFRSPNEVSPDIVRRAADVEMVIVCGGDGTMASAASGLLETGLPMGVLPLGTANDLARTVGIPLELDKAADVILRGRTRRIDVGDVNGHHFFNVASMGLSADLARKLTGQAKKRWGRLAYAVEALDLLFSCRAFRAEIVNLDDRKQVRSLQIAVGNGRFYGGGTVVRDDAAIDDGRLDLYSLDPKALWKLALMFGSFRRGRHGAWAEVLTSRCTEFDVTTEKPMPINADGDIVTQTPAHFRVQEAAIEVFAP